MPPKAQPKIYILLIKTHKLTLLVTSNATNNINSLKVEVVSGFNASALNPSSDGLIPMDVDTQDPEWEVPKIQSVNDFELCRAIKEKGRSTGRYEILDGNASIKSTLVNWEYVFMRFRDQQGNLQPIKVSFPSLTEEDEEEEQAARNKGKRKAHPDELMAESDV